MQNRQAIALTEALTARVIDLANRGCRVQVDAIGMHGKRIRLCIPTGDSVSGSEPAAELTGQIVGRCAGATAGSPCTLAVIFDSDLAETARGQIADWINRASHGGLPTAPEAPALPQLPPRLSHEDPALTLDDETDPPVCACIDLACELDTDRREYDRRPFPQSVLAQDEPRVRRILLGRDLSVGGMRIDRDPRLRVGSPLRLALHDPDGHGPLELDALVLRDDAEEGWALGFQNLDAERAARLEKLVAKLPDVASLSDLYEPEIATLACEILDD